MIKMYFPYPLAQYNFQYWWVTAQDGTSQNLQNISEHQS